ncbi:hypothetical protein [Flavobacterium aquiphilum]|uniref:hypothetical protein n=1 Tax=Flavobacterium aquiphilum TaxID=3003261 RepID=UPI0024803E32|nr:hypothetical protein [Flavobacterium aquiphilum]
MKKDYFKRKFTCILLSFLLVLQSSCVAYKSSTSTLDEAVASNCRVLVVKTDETKLKLLKIEKIDGAYYGTLKTSKGIDVIKLNESDLKRINLKDKTASTWGTIGIVVGSLGIVFAIIAGLSVQSFDVGSGY